MGQYDFIIIGGGAGAFAAAIRANELEKKTLMINAGLPLGGTCVNVGCVPSKALLHAAEIVHRAKHHGISGITLNVEKFNFSEVIGDELALVDQMRKDKYESVFEHLEHVTLLEGYANFTGAQEVEVGDQKFSAEKILIATGSTAVAPQIEGLKDAGYLTHIEALKLSEQPEELVIIGAGPLGLEFAQLFSRFGTKVTLLQRAERVFPYGEPELTDRLTQILTNEGINITTGVEIAEVRVKDGKKVVVFNPDGSSQEVSADEILVAAGKRANTEKLRVAAAGIDLDERGAIVVGKHYATSNPLVYAVGDVAALPLRQETTAGREGTIAAGNALAGESGSVDYDAVPYAIFTDPQFAGVGMTEVEQMRRTKVCACRTISLEHVPKAGILRQSEGLIKMGIDPKTKEILGVHMVGPHAAEVMAEAMMLIKNKNTIDDVTASVPMFPTMSEAIKVAALSFTKDISKISCCV